MGLVEREDVLGALHDARQRAMAGAGRLVLVEGDGGLGKTSVARAFCHGLGGPGPAGVRVLWGGCEPMEAPRPLGPVHDFARAAGGELGAVMASQHTRHETFTTLLDLLARGPTVAVVEDVHWADDATLDLLVYLARRVGGLPVLVIATVRTEEIGINPRLREAVSHLTSLGVDRVALQPLSAEAVAGLVAGTGMDAARVHEVTGGHPFFVSELIASGDPLSVPSSVRDVVLARLDRLPPAARAVAEVAAVVPDRPELALVYAASGGGPEQLAECERAHVLESDGRTVAFRHELARQAVEDSLTGARRQALHRAVLDHLLSRRHPDPARVSHHADLADAEAAVLRHAPEAAAAASRVGAHRAAAEHLARALRHADLLPETERAGLLSRSAVVHEHLADLATALAQSEAAIDLYAGAGDLDGLAAQQARHAHYLWAAARPVEARRTATEAVRTGERVPGSRGLATAWTMDAYLRMLGRDAAGTLASGERAIGLARGLGEVHLLARALNAVGSVQFILGDEAAGEALLLESLEVARRARDDERVGSAMVNLGSSAGECRQYGLAREWLTACRDWCEQRDLVTNAVYARAWLARIAFEQGAWDDALAAAHGAVAGQPVIARAVGLVVLGRVAARRGDRDASEALARAWAVACSTGDLQRVWPAAAGRAELAWLTGDGDLVPGLVSEALDRAVAARHRWAVGELGYWMWRAGALATDRRRAVLAVGAAPYVAEIRGQPDVAATLWEQLGCPYEAATARLAVGEAARVAEAVKALDQLGARPAADAGAEVLRGLGGRRPARPRESTRSNPGGLTARELEVVALVGDGLTDAEIAARIHISVKTAGHHVSAILAKLGVTSRREAARVAAGWIAGQGDPH